MCSPAAPIILRGRVLSGPPAQATAEDNHAPGGTTTENRNHLAHVASPLQHHSTREDDCCPDDGIAQDARADNPLQPISVSFLRIHSDAPESHTVVRVGQPAISVFPPPRRPLRSGLVAGMETRSFGRGGHSRAGRQLEARVGQRRPNTHEADAPATSMLTPLARAKAGQLHRHVGRRPCFAVASQGESGAPEDCSVRSPLQSAPEVLGPQEARLRTLRAARPTK